MNGFERDRHPGVEPIPHQPDRPDIPGCPHAPNPHTHIGWFTHPDPGCWLTDPHPPTHGDLSFPQACDVLRLRLAGLPTPYDRYNMQDLLCRTYLIGSGEIARQRDRADDAHVRGDWARRAVARVWALVPYNSGVPKTIPTEAVRDALTGVPADVAVFDAGGAS